MEIRYNSLSNDDRRKLSYLNREPATLACLTTSPTGPTQVPQTLYTAVVAFTLGVIDPNVRAIRGKLVGKSNNRVNIHGDALATTVLPDDRWRIAHDAVKKCIFHDGKSLGLNIRMKVYG
jgi:hypothetical protein